MNLRDALREPAPKIVGHKIGKCTCLGCNTVNIVSVGQRDPLPQSMTCRGCGGTLGCGLMMWSWKEKVGDDNIYVVEEQPIKRR